MFDLSSVDLDGSHTPAIKGGEAVEYQGRKKGRTTNALFLTDRQGLPLAMSEPVSGNHNDLFDIEVQFEVVTATLDRADIKTGALPQCRCGIRFQGLSQGLCKKGHQCQHMFQQAQRQCG